MPRLSLPLIALLAACGDDAYDLYEHEPESFRTIFVWVDPHPDIPPDLARRACESWRPEGVLCELAPSSLEAHVRIHAFTGPCEKLEEGGYPLGHATEGGDIVLEIECLHKVGGTPIDEGYLWPTIAHEVGHELGIWTHVPPEDGVALMNPMIHEGLFGITPIDHQAYLDRDEDRAVLRLTPGGCTISARE